MTVLNAGHSVLLTREEAPETYALDGVKQVWRVTDVFLEDAHRIQMQVK